MTASTASRHTAADHSNVAALIGPDRYLPRTGLAGFAKLEGSALLAEALERISEAERVIEAQRRRIAHLESLSVTDELTGIANRRGFRAQLRRALAAARRTGRGGVMVMIDLDGFKRINDTQGHAAGDAVLAQVAGVLNGHVRRSDTVARLGGDEFAVLMPDTGAGECRQRAEALDRLINALTVAWDGGAIVVRASIGIETFGPNDREGDLLARADQRMYLNKQARKAA